MAYLIESGDEINLKDLWDIVVRRRWIILSFLVVCTLTVTAIAFLTTPIYRGTATIIIEGENPDLSAQKSYSENIGGFQIYETYIETQMALIRSRRVAERVFDEFHLGETKTYKGKKDPFESFLKDISLKRMRGTRVVSISVNNPNAELVASLANRLAEVYAEDNLQKRALTFIQNQRMAYLNTEYLRLQSEYDKLSVKHAPNDPEMQAVQEAINALARRIELFKSLDQAPQRSKDRPQMEGVQASLDDMLNKIQESSVLSSARMNNVVIQDRAKIPTEIFKPKKRNNILLGLLAGLLGGLFFAFVIDYWDDTVKTEEEVKKRIGDIPFLGTIPLVKESKNGKITRESKIDHIVALQPESASAEAYRLIRTALLWFTDKATPFKDIAILSPGVGEGKTTVASNLAIALSQLGRSTLLVDTDIRRGRLRESYGLSNGRGLGQYLMREAPFEEIVRATTIPNLSLVACGKSVIDPSRLLSSPEMSAFIHEVRKRFDFVVYDTPPVMLISDTSILISQLSSVLLDLRSEVTSYSAIPKVVEMIKAANTHLVGVILDGSRHSKRYYYHYYHQYPAHPH